MGEIHGGFALVGDGYGGGNCVYVAVGEGGGEAVPRLVAEFGLESAYFAHGIEQVYVKTFDVFVFVLGFEWGKFGIGGNAQDFDA